MNKMSPHHHTHSINSNHSGRKRLWLALWINLAFLLLEFIGGIISHSLALLADAGHMLTDVAALTLALIASKLMERPGTPERTFGYLRAEVLGAFVNSASLVLICGFIVFEAIRRFATATEINGPVMLAIAAAGLAANVGSALVLSRERKTSLNMQGAFLHMVADALGSIGVIIGGAIIWLFGWPLIDPIISIFIVLLILYSSWGLLKTTTNVLLEATPANLDFEEIKKALEDIEGVEEVHDLHIWTIASGIPSLSGHLKLKSGYNAPQHWQTCLEQASTMLKDIFHIGHTTLQIEPNAYLSAHEKCSLENKAVRT
jgi:cobalt-zinc-cadmium efflux system protein